ncbi:MAG: glycoside hydrolase 43 family protein [Verrucomicrobiota bacterium JB022]|nr:glycoside hydrolase 43 family protein [Verrucomicrobiota bacterium JB022]
MSLTRATETAHQATGPWIPDLGDGTYQNPVLYADYSDPDVIRVGQDYWMTASSFCHLPGLPILHSRDMVNWELVTHALPRLTPAEAYERHQPGCGVWAPAIRHHAGKFWIFYPDPDYGIFVVTATDARGPWSAPHLLKGGRGLIDPCPLWAEDGRAWLVHAWARSRSGINNMLTLHEMAPDGSGLLDDGKVIIDANQMEGWDTLEGPKLYQHGGWYWVFAPAGGVATGYQAVFRSRNPHGPYEARMVLEQGETPVNGPHQGAWVDTPEGEHWFFHFQELQPYGRIVHLQPMRWREDGWPVMGEADDIATCGVPVLIHPKPALPAQKVAVPPTSDDFSSGQLGRQWQWQANPQRSWASLPGGSTGLRLACVPQLEPSLWQAPQLLLQKFPAPAFTARTVLDLQAVSTGDQAGLIVFGYDYAWAGLVQASEGLKLVMRLCHEAESGSPEREEIEMPAPAEVCHLQVVVAKGGACRFAWSIDGTVYQPIGPKFQARESRWVGAKVGLFAASNERRPAGHAHFQYFTIA